MNGPLVELRVHGVSGTPPEDVLDVDRVRQVAGDDLGRVFERADRLGGPLPEPDGHRTSAYHWGRLTSGSVAQGLWLLLAPFGLVNAAQFMLQRPGSATQRRAHAVAGAMLRLLGLMLTALFVLAAAVITVDLWAWQRAGAVDGVSVVLGLAGPLLLLGVYVVLARSRVVPRVPEGEAGPEMPATAVHRHTDLVRPGFFEGDPGASALRRLHVAHGLALVSVLGFAPAAVHGDGFGLLGFRLGLGVLVLVAAFVVVLGDPERSASTAWERPGPALARFHALAGPLAGWLIALSGALTAVAAIRVATERFPVAPRNLHYDGIDWASFGVVLVAMVALAVLACANAVLALSVGRADARRRPAFRPYLRGMACTVVAAAGLFLGVGYAGAFTTFLATTLSTDARTVAVPELLARVVYAWGITVVVAVVMGVVAFGCLLRARPRLRDRAAADFTADDGPRVPARWVEMIATAVWTARLKNGLAPVLTVLVVLGAVLAVFVMVELEPLLSPDWPRLDPYPREAWGWLAWVSASPTWPSDLDGNLAVLRTALIALGTAVLTGLATTLVLLGRKALRGESGRRGINVLWDVVSFWPRSAHPFVPAAYSQRAVPDLVELVRSRLAEDESAELVLCGHSQGSLLSFAALLRIEATTPRLLERVGLLTFGSQLQVVFSRAFPAYVNHDAIAHLYGALDGRWRNLYRDTDHLAGPVLSWSHDRTTRPATAEWFGRSPDERSVARPGYDEYGPDWRLVDPPVPVSPDLTRAVIEPLRRHGDYWLDAAWPRAVAAVRPRGAGRVEPPALQAPPGAGALDEVARAGAPGSAEEEPVLVRPPGRRDAGGADPVVDPPVSRG